MTDSILLAHLLTVYGENGRVTIDLADVSRFRTVTKEVDPHGNLVLTVKHVAAEDAGLVEGVRDLGTGMTTE